MAYNPPIKRYARDHTPIVPNVEFCPTEFPRLHSFPAPYLPLQLEIEKHDEFFVVLTGKVIALDSYGFLVPAGYKLEQEAVDALKAVAGDPTDIDFVAADLIKYTATDVTKGVKNSRGVTVVAGEPVVYSMIRVDDVALGNWSTGAAATSTSVDLDGELTYVPEVNEHIGVAHYSWLRTNTDTYTRAANAHLFNTGAVTGKEALFAEDDGTLERNEHWQLQMGPKTVRTNYCLVYPVVADRSGIELDGQAVAIGANMAAFKLGDRVTYNRDSDIVVHAAEVIESAVLTGDDAADLEAVNAALASVATSIEKYHKRSVGQVINKLTRHPKSLLNKVKTRWDNSVPGLENFQELDKMPGSATDGYNWAMHAAGSTAGEIVISLFMR